MFCKKCGAEIPEGKKFCADCGTPVTVEKKNNKIALIVVGCIAIVAIICAVVFGVKLAGGNNAEVSTTTQTTTEVIAETTEVTTAIPTTTTTTAAPTTAAPTTTEAETVATSKKVTTTKKQTKPSTTKKQTTNSSGLVVGKAYDKIPFNVKTKNIRHILWRGYLINESDDAQIIMKYRDDYRIQSMEVEYFKNSLKNIAIKKMIVTYSSSGEAVVTAVNHLGITLTYTEEDFIERHGTDGLMSLEAAEAEYSGMLFLDPFALLELNSPGISDKIGDYIYQGKETLKTGTAHKFDVDSPETEEVLHFWIDDTSGALAKLTITYQGKETTYVEASEINSGLIL